MTQQSRPTRRLRPIPIVLSVLLALAGVFTFAAPAQAAVDEITGTVSSTDPAHVVPVGTKIYLSADLSTVGGPSGPLFTSTVPVATTGPGGAYTISGVAPGVYFVLADAGDDWVQVQGVFDAVLVDGASDPGAIADIDLEPGVVIKGTVRPESMPGGSIEYAAVGALSNSGSGGFFDDGTYFDILTFNWDLLAPQTPLDGTYRIVVPLDATYEVNAFDPWPFTIFAPQSWDHLGGSGGVCGCGGDFTPVSTPDDSGWPYGAYAPTSAIDFDLRAYHEYLWFQVQAVHGALLTPYQNVHVFLQYDAGGGTWVDVADALTDVDGFVDLYTTDDGDYRLRFEIGGTQVAVLDANDAFGCGCGSSYTLTDGDTRVELGSYAKSSPGDGYFEGADAEVSFAAPASGGGSGGTPAPPASRKPTRAGFSGTADIVTPTPTPTPTPTSTPSPSSSPLSSPSVSPEPTDEPEQASNGADLWWLWIILAVIVALILFFLARLILGRRS